MDGHTYNMVMERLYLGDKKRRVIDMTEYSYEYTDTFGGERNYAWVKRGTVKARDYKHAMKLARNVLGMTGVKGDYSDTGHYAEWKPRGCCTILTVTEGSE